MSITIYNDDCLKVLKTIPDRSVDLIITDPPYELENHGGGKSQLAKRNLCRDTDNFVGFMSNGFNMDAVFNQFIRVCKIPNMYIFCSNSQISKIMSFFEQRDIPTTLLVWNKTNPIPFCNGKYLSDIEFIVYVHLKGVTFNNNTPFEYKHKVYSSSTVSKKDRLHTAQKPTELLSRYISISSKENETILDCFMGSGSTGVSCIQTNRNFIGIELDEKYFNLAKARLEKEESKIKTKLF
jgi:DNA modification methylase